MVYPTESLYHAFSFGCILSVLRRRYRMATVLAAAPFLVSSVHRHRIPLDPGLMVGA